MPRSSGNPQSGRRDRTRRTRLVSSMSPRRSTTATSSGVSVRQGRARERARRAAAGPTPSASSARWASTCRGSGRRFRTGRGTSRSGDEHRRRLRSASAAGRQIDSRLASPAPRVVSPASRARRRSMRGALSPALTSATRHESPGPGTPARSPAASARRTANRDELVEEKSRAVEDHGRRSRTLPSRLIARGLEQPPVVHRRLVSRRGAGAGRSSGGRARRARARTFPG